MWIRFKKGDNVVIECVKVKVAINRGPQILVAQQEVCLQGLRWCKEIKKSYLNASLCDHVTASLFHTVDLSFARVCPLSNLAYS